MEERELLSISDFALLTGIKESSLRYYDKLGLFSPAVRGDNGYRYYIPQQIITIKTLSLLHQLDMPIKEISELENNRTPGRMMDILTKKEEELEVQLKTLQQSFNVIQTRRRLIQSGMEHDVETLQVEYLDEFCYTLGPVTEFRNAEDFYQPFLDFCESAHESRVDLRLPVGGLFPSMDFYLERPSMPERFFSIDPEGVVKRPAGKYLVGYVRGFYGVTNGLEKKMHDWIKENGAKTIGPVFNIFLLDEISMINPDHYMLQASVRIA